MLFAFDVATSLFAWWWVMLRVAKYGWGSTPRRTCKSTAKNWNSVGRGETAKPAERPYIITMPTIPGGEGIDNYASWVVAMADFLDCELIFFFCGIRVDVKPGASVEDCFGQWLRVFKEIDG